MDLVFQLCGSILLVIFGLLKGKRKMVHELITIIKPRNISKCDAFDKLLDKYLLIIGFLSITIGYILSIFKINIFGSFMDQDVCIKSIIILGVLAIEVLLARGLSCLMLSNFHYFANKEAKETNNTMWLE